MLKGFVSFALVSTIGAVTNFEFAQFFFDHGVAWWLAATAGVAVGAVVNYAMSATLTWSPERR